MAMFSYRAADATGNIIQGTLEAREERQVVAHLQQGGLIPLRINLAEAATRWQERLPLRRGRVPSREIVNFTQELAALLKAGLPLDRSLQALEHVTSRSAMKTILAQVLRDLQEGKTLGEGLSRARIFSPSMSALTITYKSIW
jgi:general secretion pathway protein F